MLTRIFDSIIWLLLILLLIFTPIAFGSQVLWAYSVMELAILLILMLWAIQRFGYPSSVDSRRNGLGVTAHGSNPTNAPLSLIIILLSLFLGVVLLQMIPLPSGIVKTISPKAYELRQELAVLSPVTNNTVQMTTLSFFPFGTKLEFMKWLSLVGLFFFLLHWRTWKTRNGSTNTIVLTIFLVGVFESLYGMLEFFSGHRHILNVDLTDHIRSVTGTFFNRNCFAGYLLMVIPLTIGFLFSREVSRSGRILSWRDRLSTMDGKDLLLGFGVILMILGLLLSASRAGIVSLLVSFSLMIFFFRNPRRKQGFSRAAVLFLGLAVLWAAWIGLDTVVGRFFTASEDFMTERWIRWVDTYSIFKDFPILGSGLGTFTEVFSMYRSFHALSIDIQAENDFLQLASEVGLVGAIPLLVLFVFLFYRAASGIHSLTHRESRRFIGMGGLVGILAFMVHSIVQKNLQLPANAFLYTVIWAIVFRIANAPGGRTSRPRETRREFS